MNSLAKISLNTLFTIMNGLRAQHEVGPARDQAITQKVAEIQLSSLTLEYLQSENPNDGYKTFNILLNVCEALAGMKHIKAFHDSLSSEQITAIYQCIPSFFGCLNDLVFAEPFSEETGATFIKMMIMAGDHLLNLLDSLDERSRPVWLAALLKYTMNFIDHSDFIKISDNPSSAAQLLFESEPFDVGQFLQYINFMGLVLRYSDPDNPEFVISNDRFKAFIVSRLNNIVFQEHLNTSLRSMSMQTTKSEPNTLIAVLQELVKSEVPELTSRDRVISNNPSAMLNTSKPSNSSDLEEYVNSLELD